MSRIAALIAALWIVSSAIATIIIYEELSEVLDSSLEETAHRIAPLVRSIEQLHNGNVFLPLQPGTENYEHEEYVSYQIRDRGGRLLFRSHDAPDAGWQFNHQDGFSTEGSWRIYTVQLKSDDVIIQVGENLDHRVVAITEATLAMVAPILIVLPILLLFIRHILNRGFMPMMAFTQEIERRGSENLSDVAAAGLPIEFDPIRNRLNALLARVRLMLDAERSFSSNSAHQLRTPVAAALAQSEMLERELSGAPQIERTKKLSEALRRLGRVVEKLLQLARSDMASSAQLGLVNPAEIITMLLEDYQKMNPHRKFILSGMERAKSFLADSDTLGIIFQNLIENALSYSTPDTAIEIKCIDSRNMIFSNDCEPLSSELLGRLGDRFVRGANDMRGSGLGLAIVTSLARKSQIQVELHSPARNSNRGFEVQLSFPQQERI